MIDVMFYFSAKLVNHDIHRLSWNKLFITKLHGDTKSWDDGMML